MKKIFFGLFFVAFFLATTKVQAAGNVGLTANTTSVNIGDEFTISISLSGAEVASLTARVTVDTSKVEFVSGPSNSNFRNGRIIYTWTDPNGGDSPLTGGTIATFTLKARAGGNAGFSVSGDFYAPNESTLDLDFSGVTVTVIEPTTPEPTPVQTPEQTSTPEPTAEPTATPTPTLASTSTPEITPEPTQQPTLTPTTVPEIPTPTSNTSTLAPNQEEPQDANEERSSNTNLKSLRLDVALLTPSFAPDVLDYQAIVNEGVSNIDVLAVAENANSSIGITGNNDLQMGTNLIQVTVIAQNGNKKTYNITVNKTNEADESNSYLENLAIENVFLVPEFRFDEFNYKAELASTQENVNILAIPQVEGANVNIQGQENLNIGNNTITVTVTSKNGTKTSTYTILAYRKTEDEELAENEKKEIDSANLLEKNEKELTTTKNSNNAPLWAIVIILIVGVIIFVGIFIWKYWYKNKKQ